MNMLKWLGLGTKDKTSDIAKDIGIEYITEIDEYLGVQTTSAEHAVYELCQRVKKLEKDHDDL